MRGRRKAAHAERKPLQGRVRVFGLLQHQHREVCEAQLTGEKQADRAGAGNHDVIEYRAKVVHELLLCRCSTGAVPRFENHTDERSAPGQRPMFVVGISCTRRPELSFPRKDLGLPNQVCLFRQRLYTAAVIDPQRDGGNHVRSSRLEASRPILRIKCRERAAIRPRTRGVQPRVSRAIWTAPREAARTRRACGKRTQ